MENKLHKFFERPIPDVFKEYLNEPFIGYSGSEITKQIDFHYPFLRTDKIAIFQKENNGIINFKSIGQGIIYPKDTEGHYNSTIYLAMCGWLMASTASVHLAYNFLNTAPQVVEADRVKPVKSLEGDGILKPRKEGTSFWVETIIRKSKMRFVLTTTNITFGNTPYGTIEDLKFILAFKESIYTAQEVDEKK